MCTELRGCVAGKTNTTKYRQEQGLLDGALCGCSLASYCVYILITLYTRVTDLVMTVEMVLRALEPSRTEYVHPVQYVLLLTLFVVVLSLFSTDVVMKHNLLC